MQMPHIKLHYQREDAASPMRPCFDWRTVRVGYCLWCILGGSYPFYCHDLTCSILQLKSTRLELLWNQTQWETHFSFKMDYNHANIWRASFCLSTQTRGKSWLPWSVFQSFRNCLMTIICSFYGYLLNTYYVPGGGARDVLYWFLLEGHDCQGPAGAFLTANATCGGGWQRK